MWISPNLRTELDLLLMENRSVFSRRPDTGYMVVKEGVEDMEKAQEVSEVVGRSQLQLRAVASHHPKDVRTSLI